MRTRAASATRWCLADKAKWQSILHAETRTPKGTGKSWKILIKIDGSVSASKNKTGEWGAFGAHKNTPMTAPIDPQIPPPCSALP